MEFLTKLQVSSLDVLLVPMNSLMGFILSI
jgi:hypothetical protein